MTNEMKELMAILENDGGFTVDKNGNFAKNGFMVAKQNFETVIPQSLVTLELLTSLYKSYKSK